MPLIGTLTSFNPGQTILATAVNGNFNEIKTKVNAYCVFKDATSNTVSGDFLVGGYLGVSATGVRSSTANPVKFRRDDGGQYVAQFDANSIVELRLTNTNTAPPLNIGIKGESGGKLTFTNLDDGTVLLVLDNGTVVMAGGNLRLIGSSTGTATAGTSGAPPGQVAGYLTGSYSGTNIRIPYYLA